MKNITVEYSVFVKALLAEKKKTDSDPDWILNAADIDCLEMDINKFTSRATQFPTTVIYETDGLNTIIRYRYIDDDVCEYETNTVVMYNARYEEFFNKLAKA